MEKTISLSNLYIVNPSRVKEINCKKSSRKGTLKQKVTFESLPSLSIAYSSTNGRYIDLFTPQNPSGTYKRKTIYRNAKTVIGIFTTPEPIGYIGVFPHDIKPLADYDLKQLPSSKNVSRLIAFKQAFMKEDYMVDELQEFYEKLHQIKLEPRQKKKIYEVPIIPQNKILMNGTLFDLTPTYTGSDRDIVRHLNKSLNKVAKRFKI